jgi:hypothetical protein
LRVDTYALGLLVEPAPRQAHRAGDVPRLFQDHTMGDERRDDVTSHPAGVVGQRHRSTNDDEDVADDAPAHQPITESREDALQLRPVEQSPVTHAAAAGRRASRAGVKPVVI